MKLINPLKAWASWGGLFLGLCFAVFIVKGGVVLGLPRLFACVPSIPGGCWTATAYSNMIYTPILGFLLGWIVQGQLVSIQKSKQKRKAK